MDEYIDLEQYFAEHPEEEDEFIEEMYRLSNMDEVIDYPEDWYVPEAYYWLMQEARHGIA